MGEYVRKVSSSRMRTPAAARDTLMPCVACSGAGHRLVETDSAYRQITCRWCDGTGTWTQELARMYVRWLAMSSAGRKVGRIEPKLR